MTMKTARLLGRLMSVTFLCMGLVLATNGIEDVSFSSAPAKKSSQTNQIQLSKNGDKGRQLLTSPQITFSQGYYDKALLNKDRLEIAYVRSNVAWSSIRCDLWGSTNSRTSQSDMRIVKSWVPCQSPVNINNFPYDGSYNFIVTGDPLDSSSNVVVSSQWIIDRIAPVVTLLNVTTQCGSNTCIQFVFSAADSNEISSFECRVDQESWFRCSSPYSVTVAQTSTELRTFQVRATDSAGNMNTSPAYHRKTEDDTPPSTGITSAVTLNGDSAQKRFYFSGYDANGIDKYECKLDSGSWYECASPRTVTVSRTSSPTHTFQVRAIDAYGNVDPTPATYSWKIDPTPPNTNLDSAETVDNTETRKRFIFSSSDQNRVARFECQLDGEQWAQCTSPHNAIVSSTRSAQHTFKVRAVDHQGNADPSPATYTWSIDRTPPETTIVSSVFTEGSGSRMQFFFTGSDQNAVNRFECKLDEGPSHVCTSPYNVVVSSTASEEHSFQVRAVDEHGNVDLTPAVYRWTVDTIPPVTRILSAVAVDDRNAQMQFTFTTEDPDESIYEFQCRVDGQVWTTCTTPTTITVVTTSLSEHVFEVRAVDASGNIDPTPAVHAWVVQPLPPTTTLLFAHALDSRNVLMEFSFTGSSDEGVDKFQCRVDNHHWWSCTSPASFEISDVSTAQHSFEVRAIDTTGRVDPTPAFYSWTLDAELTPVETQSSNPLPSFPPEDSPDKDDSESSGSSFPSMVVFIVIIVVGVLVLVGFLVLCQRALFCRRLSKAQHYP